MKNITFRKFIWCLIITTITTISILTPVANYVLMDTPTTVHAAEFSNIPNYPQLLPTPPYAKTLPRTVPKRVYTNQELALRPIAFRAAIDCGIDPNLFFELIYVESRWKSNAMSNKGAYGPTQLMPITAKHMGVNRYDVRSNLYGGACYFREMKERFNSTRVALWAYNTGPGNVERGRIPQSTKQYAETIMARAGIEE